MINVSLNTYYETETARHLFSFDHCSILNTLPSRTNFSRGVGGGVFVILWKIQRGGGSLLPSKNGKSGEEGGPKRNSLRGGGMDIFWNHTIVKTSTGTKKKKVQGNIESKSTNYNSTCSYRNEK